MVSQLDLLAPGTAAPTFVLPYSSAQSFSFHAAFGHPGVLLFYPFDWEPVSRQQLALFQDYLVELDRHRAGLLAISTDHIWSHQAFACDIRLRFPLLSDW